MVISSDLCQQCFIDDGVMPYYLQRQVKNVNITKNDTKTVYQTEQIDTTVATDLSLDSWSYSADPDSAQDIKQRFKLKNSYCSNLLWQIKTSLWKLNKINTKNRLYKQWQVTA